jgi:hypothetical protein
MVPRKMKFWSCEVGEDSLNLCDYSNACVEEVLSATKNSLLIASFSGVLGDG